VLVPDPAVGREHTFPVVEHTTGEPPGERALVVGVDVYLTTPNETITQQCAIAR
jgi:hypothetical protein